MILKPILRRDHRNTSCRISSRTREGITPFPSETSTFVDRLDKLALSRNKFHYQIPGNRRLKFQKDSRRAHKPPTLPVIWVWENAERERERERGIIDRLDVAPSILVDSTATLFIRHWLTNVFESDFSLTIYIFLICLLLIMPFIDHVCSVRMKWDNLRIGKLTKF